jgi:hypothetical protein
LTQSVGESPRTRRALWNLNHIIDSKCRIKPEDKGLMESQPIIDSKCRIKPKDTGITGIRGVV